MGTIEDKTRRFYFAPSTAFLAVQISVWAMEKAAVRTLRSRPVGEGQATAVVVPTATDRGCLAGEN
jgi:hypothetical protein